MQTGEGMDPTEPVTTEPVTAGLGATGPVTTVTDGTPFCRETIISSR